MENITIRGALSKNGIKHYALAEWLGISEYTLSRKLRKELPQDEQERILKLIEERGRSNA